jgi:hypothetical protein
MAQESALLEPARRAADQPLNEEMKIQPIDRMRTAALEPGELVRRTPPLLRRQIACAQDVPPICPFAGMTKPIIRQRNILCSLPACMDIR